MGVAEVFTEFGDIYLQSVISTWLMTAVCFAGGLTLGIIITVLRVSPLKPLRVVGDVYVQLFRNIPTVSLLVIFVYALPYLGATLPYRACLLACVILIVSAFASENFMSGINAIGVGQIEAARSVGLSFTQIIRLVVIPQSLRTTVLPMTNLLIATLLTTAMGSQVPLIAGAAHAPRAHRHGELRQLPLGGGHLGVRGLRDLLRRHVGRPRVPREPPR